MQDPVSDLIEEARRILDEASNSGVTLRLVGGVAVRLSCPSASKEPLARMYRDADLVGRGSETRKIKELFARLGYAPRETFNAMQGGRRMIFNDLANQRRVDIFQDYFQMSHKLDLRQRMALRAMTLPLADLLETKLQIVQMNDKDYKDILALLIDHEFGPDDRGEQINSGHTVGLCADDWGIYKTFTTNLQKVVENLGRFPLEKAKSDLAETRAKKLASDIESAPKTLRWRLRARIGERVAWYETPEADAGVVDSRF